MPAVAPEPTIHAGDVLAGKYRVDRILGVGGMGMVVAATHLALHQAVAIKVMLPSSLSSGEAIERFLREGRAVARLRSPHVPRVVDVGTLETGQPYMVMELLDGEDLGHLLERSGPLPVADAVDYIRQACEALVDAHAAGIVHRDLKPENLFLAREARGRTAVKVLDFGISKSLEQDPTNLALTATSAIMGSPLYMSPEQMRASRDVDARTDIWSLGVTLYQLVVGEVPFKAESPMELGAKVLHEEPTAPRARRPDLPKAVEALILRCLEKDRAKRFQDAGALQLALREQSAGLGAPTGLQPMVSTSTRVSLGPPGGTPSSGSRTLPYSETVAADTGATLARRRGLVALGVILGFAAIGGSVFVLRPHGQTTVPPPASAPTGPVVASTVAQPPATSSPSTSSSELASASPVSSDLAQVASARPAPPSASTGPRPARTAKSAASAAPSATPSPAPTPPPAAPTNPLDHL